MTTLHQFTVRTSNHVKVKVRQRALYCLSVKVNVKREMDSFFSYTQSCPSGPTLVEAPDTDCFINPLLMCNGIRNCDDCWDEVYENCLAIECSGSKPKLHQSMH